MYKIPRNVTICAATLCEIYVLHQKDLLNLFADFPEGMCAPFYSLYQQKCLHLLHFSYTSLVHYVMIWAVFSMLLYQGGIKHFVGLWPLGHKISKPDGQHLNCGRGTIYNRSARELTKIPGNCILCIEYQDLYTVHNIPGDYMH